MPYLFGNKITLCKKSVFSFFKILAIKKPYFKEKINQSIWIYLNLTKQNQDVSRGCVWAIFIMLRRMRLVIPMKAEIPPERYTSGHFPIQRALNTRLPFSRERRDFCCSFRFPFCHSHSSPMSSPSIFIHYPCISHPSFPSLSPSFPRKRESRVWAYYIVHR